MPGTHTPKEKDITGQQTQIHRAVLQLPVFYCPPFMSCYCDKMLRGKNYNSSSGENGLISARSSRVQPVFDGDIMTRLGAPGHTTFTTKSRVKNACMFTFSLLSPLYTVQVPNLGNGAAQSGLGLPTLTQFPTDTPTGPSLQSLTETLPKIDSGVCHVDS